ncbi:xylose isomerase-like protein [Podospora australis]|uniref:Xylose isomerase-like protein n=1 Tax=Podospora australis TaxID=1536484 RepID=A0AAN7ADA2_9PEZI|nr:xylose isomerase-like protein [Podospora australis]
MVLLGRNKYRPPSPILCVAVQNTPTSFHQQPLFLISLRKNRRLLPLPQVNKANMPCRPAISSLSLGLPSIHSLAHRLDQAARYNLDIELFHDDVLEQAKQFSTSSSPGEAQLQAASHIRALCDARNITIVCLQPFRQYEGLLDRSLHAERIEETKLWIKLASILGTNLIGIPSSFLPVEEASGDIDLIISDLRELAHLGAPHGIRFTYEALAWGTHIDTWEQSWEVVKSVDRPNFGICLDTFNICGRVFADPASTTGMTPNAQSAMQESLRRMKAEVDVKKLFWVQVVDAERLDTPLLPDRHPFYVKGQPARMSWSRNCRLFYGEEERGTYLPVKEVLEVIFGDLGFRGCVSAELFNRSLAETGDNVPKEHAERAKASFAKLAEDFAYAL